MKNLIYLLIIILTHCSLYAEQLTVNLNAKVKMSESPQVTLDQNIEITLVYDSLPNGSEFPGNYMPLEGGSFSSIDGMYNDLTPGSKIIVNFPNGLVAETSLSASPFLNINSSVIDYSTGVFQRNISFRSDSPSANTAALIQSVDIYFEEIFYHQPNVFKSDWNKQPEQYVMAEFYINIDGANVLADITSIDTQAPDAPDPVVTPFNVSFKAKIIESQDPSVNIDEIIEGVLSYDLEFADNYNLANPFLGGSGGGMPNHYMVYDESPGSQLEVNLPNGLTFRTPYSAQPFLTLDSQITDHNNGIYEREASFTSGSSMSNPTNIHMGMYFKETLFEVPSILKTDWSKSLSGYDNGEFYLAINGQYIIAEIIELAVDEPEGPPAVELNATLSATQLPNQGGELTIDNRITNNTEQAMAVMYWQTISMPNGSQYPITLPVTHSLIELDQHTILTAFTVPEYWQSGSYTHHINVISVNDGQVITYSTSFVKSE